MIGKVFDEMYGIGNQISLCGYGHGKSLSETQPPGASERGEMGSLMW